MEEKPNGEKKRIGMVVIRGNSVVMLEVCGRHIVVLDGTNMVCVQALERMGDDRRRGGE